MEGVIDPPRLVLGRYRLEQQLGAGASATVWRAHDIRAERDVALKLVHPHLVADESVRMRLRAEAESARRVRHPTILRLLEAHLDDDQPALAFEYVPGETLAQQLSREGRLDRRLVAIIGAAVAEGLAHAHRQGVVHRDVKPSNVLLGEDGSVRLLDFGISGQAGQSLLTDAGSAVGTLPYMSPEQLAGHAPDPASDVYSLGALLYQMLTGRPPYDAPNQVVMAEQQRTPPPLPDGAQRAVGLVALAAMRHHAPARPSAAAVAGQLRQLAAGGIDAPTERLAAAGPATSVLAVPAAHRRRPRSLPAVLGVAGAAVALAIALAAVSPELARAPGQPSPPPAAQEPPREAVAAEQEAQPAAQRSAEDAAHKVNDGKDNRNDGKAKGKQKPGKGKGRQRSGR